MIDPGPFPSPLAGEGGARREAVGGRGGVALSRARAMRRDPSDAERSLWRLLRNRRLATYKFRRQQPIGRYIVDFVCFERRLIVEADGSQHIESAYDRDRDHWLTQQGFRVLRLFNFDILDNPEGVCTAILIALHGVGNGIEPSPTPPLSPALPRKGGGSPRSI